MRYSTEPKDRVCVKGYGYLAFARNMGTKLSSKCGHKRLDSAKKSRTDAIKTASKYAIQKTAEGTGYLIGNKIADKITSFFEKSWTCSQNDESNDEFETPKERYISPEKRQQIIEELRLV